MYKRILKVGLGAGAVLFLFGLLEASAESLLLAVPYEYLLDAPQLVFNFVIGIVWACIFTLIFQMTLNVWPKDTWRRGLYFGAMIGIITSAAIVNSLFFGMLLYPEEVAVLEEGVGAISNLAGSLVYGIVISWLWGKTER